MTAEEATPNEETQERVPVNRREFLNFAWLVSMGFLTISVAGVTYLFVLPRFKEGALRVYRMSLIHQKILPRPSSG
jgi:hypothetical protein